MADEQQQDLFYCICHYVNQHAGAMNRLLLGVSNSEGLSTDTGDVVRLLGGQQQDSSSSMPGPLVLIFGLWLFVTFFLFLARPSRSQVLEPVTKPARSLAESNNTRRDDDPSAPPS